MAEKSEVVSLLLREFEENEADWLWQIDTNRRVRGVSPALRLRARARPASEIEGKPFIQLIAGDAWETGQFPPSLHDLAERLKRRESFSNLLVQGRRSAASSRWWELSGTPMLDEQRQLRRLPRGRLGRHRAARIDEKIAYLARYDTLTGLPNRLMLTEALGEALRYAEQWRTRCAFLMIDLDRFKAVNDSLGHLIGDQLLAQVSERLKELIERERAVRPPGRRRVRDRDPRRVRPRPRRARSPSASSSALSQPYEVDHHTLYVGASVGSAIGPRDGTTVETLMRNADLALYRAKDEGGGEHCTYEPSLHANAEERRKLEFSLRRALEQQRAAAQLPAGGRCQDRAASSASRRCCAGTARSTASSARSSSSRWPRTPA